MVQPQDRKQVLQKSGRCFICLRRGHISHECTSHKKCYKCSGRHHFSICTKGNKTPPSQNGSRQTKTEISSDTQTIQSDPPAAFRSKLNAGAPAFQTQEHRSTSLWVNSSRSILLQTAQALVFNPSSPHLSQQVRIVLDSGSQRSYVTKRVARELSLRPEGTQPMTILTFSSSQEHSQVCNYVRLGFELKNGQTKQLLLYSVPFICEPLTS